MINLTAIIIAKNESEMISDAIKSVKFADEVLIVDSGSSDNTVEISKKLGAKVVSTTGSDWSLFRNTGIKSAKGQWLLFVDADERVSPELAKEIQQVVTSDKPAAYLLPRKNNYLGKFMNYGGWGNEKIARLFHKSILQGYRGVLHEQPSISGPMLSLNNPLLHYSHRSLSSMVEKTIVFTNHEATLRFNINHPLIAPWRIFRIMLTEFHFRFLKNQAWKDGPAGIIDGIFQIYNAFIIYARLWEMQNEKSTRS